MYLFIFNPVAGRGRSVKIFEDVKKIFDDAGQVYEVWQTTRAGEAKQLAQQAIKKNYRNIVSVGGDGTLLEVVTGLFGYECNLGVIPAGTGNDFVRSLGIGADHIHAAKVILLGNIRNVDIGSTIENNYFVNVAGTGFDTEVVRYTEQFKASFNGQAAYVLGILRSVFAYKNKRMRITMDGNTIEKKVFLIAIANGYTYAGGMKVAPNATPFDGYFDVTLFEAIPNYKVPVLLPSFIKGKHERIKQISSYKCREVTVEFIDGSGPINMDGEIIGSTPMTFKIAEKAFKMFVPEQANK